VSEDTIGKDLNMIRAAIRIDDANRSEQGYGESELPRERGNRATSQARELTMRNSRAKRFNFFAFLLRSDYMHFSCNFLDRIMAPFRSGFFFEPSQSERGESFFVRAETRELSATLYRAAILLYFDVIVASA
jgi:hypothetical protein